MIFEQQNQKKISEKSFFFRKNLKKKQNLGGILIFFQLKVTIPNAHPVHISSRSDYCITLS